VRRPSFHKHCWASIIKDLIDQSAMSVPDWLLGAIIRQNQIQALIYRAINRQWRANYQRSFDIVDGSFSDHLTG
jgi:hypothetical protein